MMKKIKFSKKLGLFALSMVTAASIGVAAVTAAPVSVNAAYDYKETPKSDEYIASLFEVKGGGITVTPGYSCEADDKVSPSSNGNGVLLTFAFGTKAETSSVEITKTFKVGELKKAITVLPLVNEAGAAGLSSSFSELEIEIYEKSNGSETEANVVTIAMKPNSNWVGGNQSATAVKATRAVTPLVNQTFAGYNLSSHDRLTNTPYKGVKYLRKFDNAFYTNAGFTGGKGSVEARDITFGYLEEDGNVFVLTDRPANGGLGYAGNDEAVKGLSVIRNLNEDTNARFVDKEGANNDFANALGSDQTFDGFTENADLHIRIKATGNVQNARLVVSNIAGEDLSSPIKVEGAAYKAVVNKPYTLPVVKSFFKKAEGEAFEGTYTVYGPDGEIVTEKDSEGTVIKEEKDIAYSEHATFTPKAVGAYKIVYSVKDAEDNKYEGYYRFEAIESATLKFTQLPKERNGFNTTRGSEFDLGAAATSTVYDEGSDNTKVSVEVLYYGASYENTVTVEKSIDDVGTSYPYVFKNAGKYRLVYRAYDEAGNELYFGDKQFKPDLSKEVTINCVELEIKNLYSSLTIQKYNDWAYGVQTETVKINRDVVKFFNNDYGRNFWGEEAANAKCTMKVKAPGAVANENGADENGFVTFTESELVNGYSFGKKFGLYEFTYELAYNLKDGSGTDGVTEEFKINLLDDQAPEIYLIDSEYVYGAVGLESQNGKNFVYNVTVGSKIKFGALRAEDKVGVKFDYTKDIKLDKILNGKTTPVSDYNAENGAYELKDAFKEDDNGVIYRFSVQEEDGTGSDSITVTFKVQKSFITVDYDKVINATYGTGETVKFNGFNVLNEKSELVSATKSISVLRKGDEATVIANGAGDYKFVLSGEYVITFKAEYDGAKAEKSYNVTVLDKTAPEITVKGSVVKKGVKGEGVSVPEFSGSDLESSASATIKVVNAAGEEINVFEGKFVPTEAGTYTVTITAVDEAGNVNAYSYTVEVAEEAIKSFPLFRVLGFTIGGVLIAAAAALFVLTFAVKKKPVSELDGEEPESDEKDDLN